MKNEGQKIISRVGIYGAGRLIRGLSSFLMLPIYTRFLSPADYGTIELLNMAIDFAAMLFGARITVGMFRFYQQEKDPQNKKKVITTSLYITTLLNTLCIITLALFSTQLSQLLFGEEGYTLAFSLFSLTLLLGAVSEVGMGYLRILDRPYIYVGLSLVRLLLQLGLNIYFIVIQELTFMGVIYSAVISSATMAIGLSTYILAKNGLKANWELIKPMIIFSLPIILASLAMFFIAFGDRYLLRIYHSIEVIGIYALAYKFGTILFDLIWSPFMTYWESKQYDYTENPEGKKQIAATFRYMSIVLIFAAIGISIFSKEVIYIMADPSFHNATSMVPFITFAYLFQAWSDYHRIGLLHTGKTKYIAYSTYITAGIIAILYFLLIPAYGAYGAAIATAIAMFCRFYLTYYWSQRALFIPYKLASTYTLLLIAIISTFAIVTLDVSVMNFFIKLFLYLTLIIGIFYSPFIEQNVRDQIISVLNQFRNKFTFLSRQ